MARTAQAARKTAPKPATRRAPTAVEVTRAVAAQKLLEQAQASRRRRVRRAKTPAQDLANAERAAKAAKTPIAKQATQGVLERKRRAYKQPTGKGGSR